MNVIWYYEIENQKPTNKKHIITIYDDAKVQVECSLPEIKRWTEVIEHRPIEIQQLTEKQSQLYVVYPAIYLTIGNHDYQIANFATVKPYQNSVSGQRLTNFMKYSWEIKHGTK